MLERAAGAESALREPELPLKLPTRIITCAWGEKYVNELLSITVPALLAPGNLPYVASVTSCELVIVTEEASFPRITADSAIHRVREICSLRLVGMDDLIPSRDAYGMAITYALHRGFSDLGSSATDAWLLFLNADFILADGSLRTVIEHFARGERLIAAPSYCVKAEEAASEVLKRIDVRSRALSIPPREMAALVLEHRHDSMRGKTVNQDALTIRYMDQFYWLADANTLLGHQMPVAIVGMRPERNLPEPNSFWDYGLIREFCPTAQHFVLGDSDEFLMMELRREHVTEGWLAAGRAKPADIAKNMMIFATPYMKDMARYPLTLHSGELPHDVQEARTKLWAFVEGVLDYLPRELPSHLGHPQFDCHWSRFMEARHRYLSRRLGAATERQAPPDSLTELDRVWWKLDGLIKAYSRKRSELTGLMTRQREVADGLVSRLQDNLRKQQAEADERLLGALCEIPSSDTRTIVELNHVVRLNVKQGDLTVSSSSPISSDDASPEPILRHLEQSAQFSSDTEKKKEQLTSALHFIEKYYDEYLLRLEADFDSVREQLQFDYERLLKRPAVAAGNPVAGASDKALVWRIIHGIYHRCYGRIPRVRLLHPYWAALRHLVRVVDTSADSGAANVLVVTEGGGMTDRISEHLAGVHVQVPSSEVMAPSFREHWHHLIKFDLCICDLGVDELTRFRDMAIAVSQHMSRRGKIVGFYMNSNLRSVSRDERFVLQDILEPPLSAKIFYAGSKRSSRVIRRWNIVASDESGSRLRNVGRWAFLLVAMTPRALVANLLEAVKGSPSHAPKDCTSITIEIDL